MNLAEQQRPTHVPLQARGLGKVQDTNRDLDLITDGSNKSNIIKLHNQLIEE
jgi:hypothetical protein